MYFVWIAATICDVLLIFLIEVRWNFYGLQTMFKLLINTFCHIFQFHNAFGTAVLRMMKPIYLFIWVVLLLFVLCETANNVSDRFMNISIYEQCDWYEFPIGLQQQILLFTQNTQQRATIKAFGNIECVRETFKRVNEKNSKIQFQF